MKDDMSGAGAVLGAFQYLATAAAAGAELAVPLVAALCLAENCIGPDSYRPDDILTMHSGKTVEVGNTDAEGRFVIGVSRGSGASMLESRRSRTALLFSD